MWARSTLSPLLRRQPITLEVAIIQQCTSCKRRELDRKDKEKVPRPPSAFIFYRQEWHQKVVEEHPDMDNIDICAFISGLYHPLRLS